MRLLNDEPVDRTPDNFHGLYLLTVVMVLLFGLFIGMKIQHAVDQSMKETQNVSRNK